MRLTDAGKAYLQIKEKIITVEMPPGSVIHESRLMQELGLGRTPIREALKQLQAENLVVVAPRRGMFVSDVPITDLPQVCEIRVELESLCVRLATQRVTREQLDELGYLITEYQRAICHPELGTGNRELGTQNLFMSLDRRFHHLLAEAAGNRFLQNEVEKFYNLSMRIWYLALNRIQPGDVGMDDHLEILHALEAQDAERGAQIMRKHIRHFHDTIKLRL